MKRADRVAAAPRLELAQGDAGGLHGPGHERAQRAAVVVEREARPQDLALVAVAEGVEGGAVDARAGARGRTRRDARRRAGRASGGEPRRRVVPMPRAARRSSSCSAALRLKASMRMPDGSAPRSTSSTTRLTRVFVLPEPAGARTRAAPRRCSTAARWASSSRAASGPAGRARRRPGRRWPRRWRPARSRHLRAAGKRAAGEAASRSRRPMSSRSSAPASPTPRLRGASTRSPNGKPRQNGRPRARSGWMKREQHVVGLRRELVGGALPEPEPDGRVAAEQRSAGLAGVLGPVAPRGEADAGGGRRRSLREVAAARDVEEHESGTGRPPRRSGGGCRSSGRLSVAVLMRGQAGSAGCARPASDASRPSGRQARVTRVDVRARARRSSAAAAAERGRGAGRRGQASAAYSAAANGMSSTVVAWRSWRGSAHSPEAQADAVEGVRILEQPEDAKGALRLRQTARLVRRCAPARPPALPRPGPAGSAAGSRSARTAASAGARRSVRPSSSARATLRAPCSGSTPSPWRPMSCQSAALSTSSPSASLQPSSSMQSLCVDVDALRVGHAVHSRDVPEPAFAERPACARARRAPRPGWDRRTAVGRSRHSASIARTPGRTDGRRPASWPGRRRRLRRWSSGRSLLAD